MAAVAPLTPPAPPPRPAGPIRVVVLDDDLAVGGTLKRVLELLGDYEVRVHGGLHDPARDPAWGPDIVFTDLIMPGADGFDVIAHYREHAPGVPVIVLSGFSSLENAVKAIKSGAFDFLAKPFNPDTVDLVLAKAVREVAERREAEERSRHLVAQDPYLATLVGSSAPMRALREWILKVRPVRASVLLEGETGTGKELVARAIHAGAGPFVAVNVASIPADLAESEFFGHRQGAFTGATQERAGLFAESHGGTLFLDEINAMSLSLQAKLLRVVQERTYRPVGGSREVPADFRLVCATNERLEELVAAGKFRRDLFHRINVLACTLPPLGARLEDVPQIAQRFLERFARLHRRNLRRISPEALTLLMTRPWPGNVRELENVIEQAVVYSEASETELGPARLQGGLRSVGAGAEDAPVTLARMQALYVRRMLERTNGNKSEAARLLDIDYKTLLRHLGRPD